MRLKLLVISQLHLVAQRSALFLHLVRQWRIQVLVLLSNALLYFPPYSDYFQSHYDLLSIWLRLASPQILYALSMKFQMHFPEYLFLKR